MTGGQCKYCGCPATAHVADDEELRGCERCGCEQFIVAEALTPNTDRRCPTPTIDRVSEERKEPTMPKTDAESLLKRVEADLETVLADLQSSFDAVKCVAQGRLEVARHAVEETRNLLYGG